MGPPGCLLFPDWRSGDRVWVTSFKTFCCHVLAPILPPNQFSFFFPLSRDHLWWSPVLFQGSVIVLSREEDGEMSLCYLILSKSLDFDTFKYIFFLVFLCSTKDVHQNTHSSSICNSPNLETTLRIFIAEKHGVFTQWYTIRQPEWANHNYKQWYGCISPTNIKQKKPEAEENTLCDSILYKVHDRQELSVL